MTDDEIAVPEENCEYSVELGRSLFASTDEEASGISLEDAHGDAAHALFQYQFTPASVDTTIPGLVSIDDSTGATVLRGTTATSADGGISFKGKIAEQKDTECLLIFDGTSFRLERCDYVVSQLRHVRAAPLQRLPPSVYPAPMGKKNLRLEFARRTGKPIQPKGPKKASAKSTDDVKSGQASTGAVGEKDTAMDEKDPSTTVPVEQPLGSESGSVEAMDGGDGEASESPSSKRRRLDAVLE